MNNDIVDLGDSYKYSHSKQYPRNTVGMFSYMESRGGVYPATVFVGLQYIMETYLSKKITYASVLKAAKKAEQHGVPFDKDGWTYIVDKLDGKLPVSIKAVREGTLIPNKMVMLTIKSTDEKVPWIEGFVETLVLKLWYPITVATKSYYTKKMLEKYGSPEWAEFAYHNFGDRGSSSVESAAVGGFAHLTQFKGTDNFNALDLCEEIYGDEMAGYSVFATEHSTTTSWGKEHELAFVEQQLVDNPNRPIMSFVADSYDVYTFTTRCVDKGSPIRQIIESRPHQKFVFRPDSGEPLEVIGRMLDIMRQSGIAYKLVNGKILFTDFAILWGDGITPQVIEDILSRFTTAGPGHILYAAENFVFGSGGDIMQNVNRDTQKFAIKCSSITLKSDLNATPEEARYMQRDVFKDPITDPGKRSKRGRVTTYIVDGQFVPGTEDKAPEGSTEALHEVFLNGEITRRTTMDNIRNISKGSLPWD